MADFRSSYWGQVSFWENSGTQIIDRLESSTSGFENIASNVFDGYLVESGNDYLKVGLVPTGSAEIWGSGFLGDTVEGVSMTRIRFQVGDYSGDASGSIRFGSGIYGDVYTYGSLSSITSQYPGVTARISGNLQFSPDGEITPINATETTTISGGPSVTSKTNEVGEYYQHTISYQGKSLTIDGSWPYESLESYLDLTRGNDVFYGSSGDDFFSSNPGNDRVEGGSGNDTVIYSGAYLTYTIDVTNPDSVTIKKAGETDTLVGIEVLTFSDQTLAISDLILAANKASKTKEVSAGAGNEIFQGTEGILDIVKLSSNFSNYQIQKVGSTVVVTDQFSNGGSDTLVGVERVQFADKGLAFDTDGATSAGGIYRLYKATFNREPDSSGLGYWISEADAEAKDAVRMAEDFVWSQEFQDLYDITTTDNYGTGTDVSELVTGFYENVLGRSPDAGGLNYYTGVIESREKTVGRVLAEISDSQENYDGTIELIANGIVFDPWVG